VYESVDSEGSAYKLEITSAGAQKAAQHITKDGDAYKLTITLSNGKIMISKGTVTVEGETLTLTPDGSAATFQITFESDKMTTISGVITSDNGTLEVTGKSLTKSSSGEGIAFPIVMDVIVPDGFTEGDFSFSQHDGHPSLSNFIDAPVIIKVKDGKVIINLGEAKANSTYPRAITETPKDVEYFENPFITEDGKYLLSWPDNGEKFAELVYVNKNSTVTGTYRNPNDGMGGILQIYENFTQKKGWNFHIVHYDQKKDAMIYESTTSSLPGGYKWRVIEVEE